EISRGEIIGVLGPNGAGKTTLINCILGLILPDHGKITAFGKDIYENRSQVLKRINFGSNYVSLPYSLTPYENLMVFANLYEVKNPSDRCRELLELFGLDKLANKPTRRLSSGQMMRLNLAKSLLNSPELLLLDEPTAGLDPGIARKTRELLITLVKQENVSVIYTSHNLHEMEEVAERVIFLNKGRIISDGTPKELMRTQSTETLEELFFKVIEDAQ
ncbi:MAG: ABC transporter ATP-binding protein, partial [Nitrospirae bacterium]